MGMVSLAPGGGRRKAMRAGTRDPQRGASMQRVPSSEREATTKSIISE